MYKIDIDMEKELVFIDISGHLMIDEVRAYLTEVREKVAQFEEKKYLLLVSAERMDPVSQECLPLFLDAISEAISRAKKMAVVHRRTVTEMQSRRIEALAYKINGSNAIKIMRCKTICEAQAYLLSNSM